MLLPVFYTAFISSLSLFSLLFKKKFSGIEKFLFLDNLETISNSKNMNIFE